jgi:hypothetical protein
LARSFDWSLSPSTLGFFPVLRSSKAQPWTLLYETTRRFFFTTFRLHCLI